VVALGELTEHLRQDQALYAGRVGGAVSNPGLTAILETSGFADIRISPKDASRSFIRDWAPGTAIENVMVCANIEAVKPAAWADNPGCRAWAICVDRCIAAMASRALLKLHWGALLDCFPGVPRGGKSRLKIIWVDQDVCRLLANHLGCWQDNVGCRFRILSVSSGRKSQCLQADAPTFAGRNI
jgi:hypothetical protein